MSMMVGNPASFAIESGITHAYERLSFRALGFFLIHIQGCRFGVCSPEATMLACSFDEVGERLRNRGRHMAFFATESNAGKIADSFRDAVYAPDQDDKLFFGVPHRAFHDLIHSNRLVWAPDGDEAFDDGSYILHFDVGNRVRLIAFKSTEGYHHGPDTLVDLWLDAGEFYGTLGKWHSAFEAEDGAEIVRGRSG